jgi:hypothetical protein
LSAAPAASPPSKTLPTPTSVPNRSVKATYFLNCAAAHALPALSAMTFAMQLAVPSDLAPGEAALTWQLLAAGAPTATTDVRITVP